MKPYAESCEQNRAPILAVLKPRLADSLALLEIGSGTGQHAVYFGAELPQLSWQTSEMAEHHPGIHAWLDEAALANVLPPLALDVSDPGAWPRDAYDAVFTANTLHIMGEPEVAALFAGVGRVLGSGGLFLIYGPFNYGGRYTSDSNARFDQWLKQRDPRSGIKDLDWLKSLADAADLLLEEDIAMPANNRVLVWRKA
jgi:cyclopropane fatty-acyl-phospholipid synthase-like methyltransferase